MTRQSYDTAIKHPRPDERGIVRLQCHAIIPPTLLSHIPRSNLHRWQQEPDDKYAGFELNGIAREQLDLLQKFSSHRTAQRTFRAYIRLAAGIQKIVFSIKGVKQEIHKRMKRVVEIGEQVRPVIGLKGLLRFLHVSRGTYVDWKDRVIRKCTGSPLSLCLRRHPQQATGSEIRKFRDWLTNPDYLHWPIASVAAFARRSGSLMLSDGSWYKYARLLDLRRIPPKVKPNRESIRAEKPDQYWHADVTEYRTSDEIKYFIYLVVDNYSRKVLAWAMAQKLRASIRLRTIREAWEASGKQSETTLVVDGGSENHNHTVHEFLSDPKVSLSLITAQVDVTFSNSMVEAVNKILKGRYIRPKAPPDGNVLRKVLEWAIQDYNEIRPHQSLDGRTPSEAYAGVDWKSMGLPEKMKAARKARIGRNRELACREC